MNNTWKIPLFKTHWENDDISSVANVLKRGTYWATGPEIGEFEKELAKLNGVKYAVAVNSGTSALHAMYLACDIKGKEVIVPSFTFVATANAVVLAGGIVKFAETEAATYGLDVDSVESMITDKTCAVVALHYSGCPSKDIVKLKALTEKKGLMLFEDNAHSMGAKIEGRLTGTFGKASALSFCQNKLISTGEGGAVTTDDQDVYEKLKMIRSHGRVEKSSGDYFAQNDEFDYTEVGYNYRMPSMCAALGLSQLKNFEHVIQKRQSAAQYLNHNLSGINEILLPLRPEGSDHFYQQYTIRLKQTELRNQLKDHLSQKGIFSNVYYTPIHLKTYYRDLLGYKKGDLPQTEAISESILTLPMFPDITINDLKFMVNSIRSFFN